MSVGGERLCVITASDHSSVLNKPVTVSAAQIHQKASSLISSRMRTAVCILACLRMSQSKRRIYGKVCVHR